MATNEVAQRVPRCRDRLRTAPTPDRRWPALALIKRTGGGGRPGVDEGREDMEARRPPSSSSSTGRAGGLRLVTGAPRWRRSTCAVDGDPAHRRGADGRRSGLGRGAPLKTRAVSRDGGGRAARPAGSGCGPWGRLCASTMSLQPHTTAAGGPPRGRHGRPAGRREAGRASLAAGRILLDEPGDPLRDRLEGGRSWTGRSR